MKFRFLAPANDEFVAAVDYYEAVDVYAPLAPHLQNEPKWLRIYHQALRNYFAQNFIAAKEDFATTQVELEREDFMCKLYTKRCDEFIANPPEANWDGAYRMTSK